MTKKHKNWNKQRKKISHKVLLSLLMLFVAGTSVFIVNNKHSLNSAPAVKQVEETAPIATEEVSVQQFDQTGKIDFGTSVEGKSITGYIFGTGDDVTLMFGSIHGNEMGTADLLNKFVNYLIDNPTVVASDKKVVIIPILNPDGYFDRIDKLNANEVNLNLNFGTSDWAMYGSEGQYAGPTAWSEPESKVLKSVVEKYLPDRIIAYHSSGSLVNPELTEASQGLAWWYAIESGYSYYADPAWDYSGTATKWFEETYAKPAVTVELNEHYLNDGDMNMSPMLQLIGE
jgi:hypothetical protein